MVSAVTEPLVVVLVEPGTDGSKFSIKSVALQFETFRKNHQNKDVSLLKTDHDNLVLNNNTCKNM